MIKSSHVILFFKKKEEKRNLGQQTGKKEINEIFKINLSSL